MSNKYGLPRHIPESIALEVRRRSKFGCVICRCAVYQYEHIDPEYSEAISHDPDNICLLCGGCHDRVTRGRLSKQTVATRYLHVTQADDIGRPFEELDLSARNICVVIGSAKFNYAKCLIRINGRDLLAITPPVDGAAFPTLNGVFCDRDATETLRITDNVWKGTNNAWDIKLAGKKLIVKTSEGRVALALEVEPPDTVFVTALDMYLENSHVLIEGGELYIGRVRAHRYTYFGIGSFECNGAESGVDIDTKTEEFKFSGVNIIGGEGVNIRGTGIRLGVGGGMMLMSNLRVWGH